MILSVVAIGVLSCFSAVFADPPNRSFLIREVQSLRQLSSDVVDHINTTSEAQIDTKLKAVDACWTMKTAEFQKEIQKMYDDQLSQILLQLTNLKRNLPNMNDDQISKLATQLFVQTDGLFEQAEDAIGAFNQKVKIVHREVLKLNTLDCGSGPVSNS
ncbi:hypothetical protein GE061_003114 [Apolygus lucorum]|uniref:Uncharacterized protein n=1 Tax=Apolygus lucorum TaxID=248454 RepID=A0A6A4JGQ9_APOLU|nr:hypothetical protein GE061_003114 [Apolygus lucorum]